MKIFKAVIGISLLMAGQAQAQTPRGASIGFYVDTVTEVMVTGVGESNAAVVKGTYGNEYEEQSWKLDSEFGRYCLKMALLALSEKKPFRNVSGGCAISTKEHKNPPAP